MLQTDKRGLRLHLGSDQGLFQIMDMVKDCEKFARKSGNFHIKSKKLYPAKKSNEDLTLLEELIKVDVERYLRKKYNLSNPKQYSIMVTTNVLDCYPRRMKRFKTKTEEFQKSPRYNCNWNLIPPISSKNSIQIDPNKAKLIIPITRKDLVKDVYKKGEGVCHIYRNRQTGEPTYKVSVKFERFNDEFTLLKDVYFSMSGPNNIKVKVPVMVPTRQLYLVEDSNLLAKLTSDGKFENRCGGWLTLAENGHTFYLTKLVAYEWETSYEPEGVIGFDYNARRQVFMTFDRPIVTVDGTDIDFSLAGESNYLPLPEFVAVALDELDTINKSLKKQTGNSEKRNRELHLRRKQLHRISTNYFKPIAKKMVEFVVKNKFILGVDDLSQGERTSIGHMNFSQFLLKELRRKKACFVVVPTPYTSMYCSECVCNTGEYVRTTEIRIDKLTGRNTVECNNRHVLDRDINAANNIAFDAEYLFFNNFLPEETESVKQTKLEGLQRLRVRGFKGLIPMLMTNIEFKFRNGYVYDYRNVEIAEPLDEDVLF